MLLFAVRIAYVQTMHSDKQTEPNNWECSADRSETEIVITFSSISSFPLVVTSCNAVTVSFKCIRGSVNGTARWNASVMVAVQFCTIALVTRTCTFCDDEFKSRKKWEKNVNLIASRNDDSHRQPTNVYEISMNTWTDWESKLILRCDVFFAAIVSFWMSENELNKIKICSPFSNALSKIILLSFDWMESMANSVSFSCCFSHVKLHHCCGGLHTTPIDFYTIDLLPIGCSPQRHKSSESHECCCALHILYNVQLYMSCVISISCGVDEHI